MYIYINRSSLNALSGIVNAFVTPAVSALVSRWAPPAERTLLASISFSGNSLGMAMGQPLSGYITDSDLGWRGSYYVIFVLHIVWYIWFYFFVYSSPEQDPYISIEERNMILSSISASEVFFLSLLSFV